VSGCEQLPARVPSGAPATATLASPITEVRLNGVINPVKARYIERSIVRSHELGASVILLSIDTPGGLVSSMQYIVERISGSSVPVVGWVEPAAAQATSAGAFILLATDLAAMRPDTRVGAAHPVGIGSSDKLDETTAQKATNSLVSLAKSLAARRGRSEEAAAAMVRDSASFTAAEAIEKHLVEWQVRDRAELIERLHGHELNFPDRKLRLDTQAHPVISLPLSHTEQLLDQLADPTLASLLVTIGVLGILYELGAPGIGLGGIVGVTSLLMGLMSLSVLPINLTGVLLMAAGVIALGLELTIPTHGLLGFGGILSMLFGGLLLFDESKYFGAAPHVDWKVQLPIVLLLGAVLLLIAAQAARALEARPITGSHALIGSEGTASGDFSPAVEGFSGTVLVQGVYWNASSTSPIESGTSVEVIEVSTRPLLLYVRRSRKARA